MNCAKAVGLLAVLAVSLSVAQSKTCFNRLDIAIAVDITAARSADEFLDVKREVKGIVAGFQVRDVAIQLALVSIGATPTIVAEFPSVVSLDYFNKKVDSLVYAPTERPKLASGIKLIKDSVFNKARKVNIVKALILVKDRRHATFAVSEGAELTQLASEASALKSTGVAIHAVGVGGLWNNRELHALYGNGYLLFKSKQKALSSAKSLNNNVCKVDCPNSGKSKAIPGLCHGTKKHVVTTKTDLTKKAGWFVCRTEISRSLEACSVDSRCNDVKRKLSSCTNGKVTITDIWNFYNTKKLSCVEEKSQQVVACADASKCPHQVADVIFLIDTSGSIKRFFSTVKVATRTILSALNVARDGVRVGVITFSFAPKVVIRLGEIPDLSGNLKAFDDRVKHTSGTTGTDEALRLAATTFSGGRKDVSKHLFILTDGKSDYPRQTVNQLAIVKNSGITVYAIGLGNAVSNPNGQIIAELNAMAAPEIKNNLVLVSDMSKLQAWASDFSKQLCLRLAKPNPKMCDNNVFIQSVSDCIGGRQIVTRTTYSYDSARQCIKSTKATQKVNCRKKCTSPVFGNEYQEGDSWTEVCLEFRCSADGLKTPSAKCQAADGSCKAIGSPPFPCIDPQGKSHSGCRCADVGGKLTLVIEKA